MNRGSLRRQWLSAFLFSTLLLVCVISTVAWWFADRRSKWQIENRMKSIATQVAQPSYPLNSAVLQSISNLTGAELVLVDESGNWVEGTLKPRAVKRSWKPPTEIGSPTTDRSTIIQHIYWVPMEDASRVAYHAAWCRFFSARQNNIHWVVILFPESTFRELRWQAALFPMITGFSTALVLGSIAGWLTNRVVRRIELVQRQVRRIAEGDYQQIVVHGPQDEISQLSTSVNQMSQDLKSLDARIHATERDRLIHNMATGLSHDLRNTLTGARLAIQLHARECKVDQESTEVAMRQLRLAEDQLQRWLRISGEDWVDSTETIQVMLERVQAIVEPTAAHLECQLTIEQGSPLGTRLVDRSALFCSAILNLLFNAIQAAGTKGEVQLKLLQNEGTKVTIEIEDSGKGPDPTIQDRMFHPMVTSKPEGVGLGLPLVAKAAQQLKGLVSWRRQNDRTIFSFQFETLK